MTPDTPKDDTGDEFHRQTFRSFELDDYFDRRRRTDHGPNAALHAALKALSKADDSPIANVNLMASHGPEQRERLGEPRYEVVVDIENHGAGSAHTGPTILKDLLQWDEVAVIGAESMSVVPESDNYEGGGDYPTDRLTVRLNPVTTKVRPVEVPYSAVPDDFAKVSTLRNDAGEILGLVAGDGATRDEFFTVADALATLIKVNAPDSDYEDVEPDAAAGVERDRLVYERSDVDVESLPDGDRDGVDVAGLVDSLEDLAYDYERAGKNRGEDLGEPWRRAASDIRVALDDHAKGFPPEPAPGFDDTGDRGETIIPCGCGEFSIKTPSNPDTIDVVCPECGNHFGHGEARDDTADSIPDVGAEPYAYDTIRFNARKVLEHAISEEGSNARTYEAARCLSTLLYLIAPDTDYRSFDNDEAAREALDELLDAVDHGFEFETSPDGMVEYVVFEDLDTDCVTYECSTTATDSRRFQFPNGFVIDVPVCDDHVDDFDPDSLLSSPRDVDDGDTVTISVKERGDDPGVYSARLPGVSVGEWHEYADPNGEYMVRVEPDANESGGGYGINPAPGKCCPDKDVVDGTCTACGHDHGDGDSVSDEDLVDVVEDLIGDHDDAAERYRGKDE